MTRALFCCLFSFACASQAQQYHYSLEYEEDTAKYAAKVRELMGLYLEYFNEGFPQPQKQRTYPYQDEEMEKARARRKAEGWDVICNLRSDGGLQYYENDTLRCIYKIPCGY